MLRRPVGRLGIFAAITVVLMAMLAVTVPANSAPTWPTSTESSAEGSLSGTKDDVIEYVVMGSELDSYAIGARIPIEIVNGVEKAALPEYVESSTGTPANWHPADPEADGRGVRRDGEEHRRGQYAGAGGSRQAVRHHRDEERQREKVHGRACRYVRFHEADRLGVEKLHYKHDLSTSAVKRATIKYYSRYNEGGNNSNSKTWIYRSKVNRVVCFKRSGVCQVTERTTVRIVDSRQDVNGTVRGIINAYCEGVPRKCRWWVKHAK